MISYRDKQYLNQLEKRKGGYYYLQVSVKPDIVNHLLDATKIHVSSNLINNLNRLSHAEIFI